MAASLCGTISGVSSLSSSFLPQSKRLPASSCTTSLIAGPGWSSQSGGGHRIGVRCRTMSLELEAPLTASSLYSVLGLEQGVDMSDIKMSYRKLARRYHPDVCPPDEREECTKMFLQVQDAYEVLSDPERRAKYDYQLMNPLSPSSVGWGSIVRRGRDSEDTAVWRSAWKEQLAHFPKKQQQADSWGAKMRAKHAAQN